MADQNQTEKIRIVQQGLLILKRSVTIASSASIVAGVFFAKVQRQAPPATSNNPAPVGMHYTVLGQTPIQSPVKDRDDDRDDDDDREDDKDDD